MDVFIPGAGEPEVARHLGRNTAETINLKAHWQALIPEAPHHFSGASDSVEVSPPIYLYCPGGYDNQNIGMCVGKGTKNGVSTLLRIPEGATFDPANPAKIPAKGPNIRLSGLWCYYNARNIHGRSGFGEGAVVAYSLDGITKKGVVPEDQWEDTEANQAAYSDRVKISAALAAVGMSHLALTAARITSRQQYFDFEAQGFPIVDGVSIGQGWMTTAADGKFTLGGRTVGGHCTLSCGYDRKLNRKYKRNSWLNWGAHTDDPEFNSDDPALGGNAHGRNNIGYCALDEFEDTYLTDAKLASGETDAFVISGSIGGFSRPNITPHSNRDNF